MTPIRVLCTISLVLTLAACSEQTATPTAPSSIGAGPLATTGGASAAHLGDASTTSTAPASPSAANFEIKFMTGMIDHHHMAVMMAEMCIAKAAHDELRSLCESIRTAQMAEIDRMQAWLQQWYGVSYEPTMKPGDQTMMERLGSLSEAEFEIAFIEM